jgi:hypothetical protein
MTPRRLCALLIASVVIALLPGAIPALTRGGGTAPVAAPALGEQVALANPGLKRHKPKPKPAAVQPVGGTCASGPTAEARRKAAACLLSGRGMWIWEFDTVEGGNPEAIVARAKSIGLSYVLIRAGSSRMGFYAQSHLDALLPVAHREGLKVLVWDFPYLEHPEDDARRVASELAYTTPDGHSVDGLAPDIEEPAQGVTLTRDRAQRFVRKLRALVGDEAVIVACTPRPSPPRLANYPYAEIAPFIDAFAPMVYWGFDGPTVDTQLAIERLGAYGVPVAPVGRAYDMRPEGGPGQPPASETLAFLKTAHDDGAPGVSFWSWQHATVETWKTIQRFNW